VKPATNLSPAKDSAFSRHFFLAQWRS